MERLNPTDHPDVLAGIADAGINTLFAQAVLQGHVSGELYGNAPTAPEVTLTRHPYGMVLLHGDLAGIRRRDGVRDRELLEELAGFLLNRTGSRAGPESLLVYPTETYAALEQLTPDNLRIAQYDETPEEAPAEDARRVVRYERINFTFRPDRYATYRSERGSAADAPGFRIVATTPSIFTSFSGHVVPSHFWDTAEDFARRGAGFTVLVDPAAARGEGAPGADADGENVPAATAFSSFVIGERLEIGIETREEFRGRGYAEAACRALIDYCLEQGYEPVWSCHAGNAGSRRLAARLGFDETLRIPYYRLPG